MGAYRKIGRSSASWNVRFGSKADMCGALAHVRFTPNSDRKSGHAATVMSALHLKADMCGANGHVRYGPEADLYIATNCSAYIFS
jgi:hypothetical protein